MLRLLLPSWSKWDPDPTTGRPGSVLESQNGSKKSRGASGSARTTPWRTEETRATTTKNLEAVGVPTVTAEDDPSVDGLEGVGRSMAELAPVGCRVAAATAAAAAAHTTGREAAAEGAAGEATTSRFQQDQTVLYVL
jgi:ribosomal protein L12E/L44/L45/RPP1/RPP2